MNRIERTGTHTDAKLTNNFAVIDDVIGPNQFIFRNAAVDTRAKALAAFPDAPINSLIIGSARVYLRVARVPQAADFQKVTVSAAD